MSGGQVVSGTHSIQLDTGPSGVDAALERIPFEGEEVSRLTFQITGPAVSDAIADLSDSEPPTLEIVQWMDGRIVGGNVLRPPRLIQIYLPITIKGNR